MDKNLSFFWEENTICCAYFTLKHQQPGEEYNNEITTTTKATAKFFKTKWITYMQNVRTIQISNFYVWCITHSWWHRWMYERERTMLCHVHSPWKKQINQTACLRHLASRGCMVNKTRTYICHVAIAQLAVTIIEDVAASHWFPPNIWWTAGSTFPLGKHQWNSIRTARCQYSRHFPCDG